MTFTWGYCCTPKRSDRKSQNYIRIDVFDQIASYDSVRVLSKQFVIVAGPRGEIKKVLVCSHYNRKGDKHQTIAEMSHAIFFYNKQYQIFNIKMERVKTTKDKSTLIVSFPHQINPVLKFQPIRKQGAPGIFPKSPLIFFRKNRLSY